MGRVGQGQDRVPEMETKIVEGWDRRWKVLEGAWVVGMCGSEFRCYMECNRMKKWHDGSKMHKMPF